MSQTTDNTRDRSGPLWALAAALTVVAIGRWLPGTPPAPTAAHAALVSSVDDSTILTYSAGNDEDLVMILDQRTETIIVYRTTPRNTMELLQASPAQDLFEQARAAGPANRR